MIMIVQIVSLVFFPYSRSYLLFYESLKVASHFHSMHIIISIELCVLVYESVVPIAGPNVYVYTKACFCQHMLTTSSDAQYDAGNRKFPQSFPLLCLSRVTFLTRKFFVSPFFSVMTRSP